MTPRPLSVRGESRKGCIECGKDDPHAELVPGGAVCRRCWDSLLRTSTTRLCDRLIELLAGYQPHPMDVSRAVAWSLPDRSDRLRVWFELKVRGLASSRAAGRRSPLLLALTDELRELDIPHKVFGQRHLPGTHGAQITCDHCGELRTMAGRTHGQALCAECRRKHPEIVRPCARCPVWEYLNKEKPCRECRAKDALDDALTDIAQSWPVLKVATDVLLAADGLHVHASLARGKLPLLLRELKEGRATVTHDGLDSLGQDAATRRLRSFLVAHGALPERNEDLLSFEAWVDDQAASIGDPGDRMAFIRYARWRHLRQARNGVLSPAKWAWRRKELKMVHAFLGFLHEQNLGIRSARQRDVDQWIVRGNTYRGNVRMFLKWCRATGINTGLEAQYPQPTPLAIPSASAESERAQLLRRSMDPDGIEDPGLRLAAILVILYGFRPHQIAALRVEDITFHNGHAMIRFGPDPLQLPVQLTEYARQAKADRVIKRFGGDGEENYWLYPGHLHGRPIVPHTLSSRLAAIGISAKTVRGAALGQLALQLPPAVLARLTGLHRLTATRWYATVSAGTARNLPTNVQHPNPGNP